MTPRPVAIVPAAGRGVRMGADKALLDLGGATAIARVVQSCRDAGIADVLVVRREGADPLPRTPQEFTQTIADDIVKWAKVVKAGNLKVE